MFISIIFCTHNRDSYMRDALISILGQDVSGLEDYEVIVVDNNSTDNTKNVVVSISPEFKGKLRYVHERSQGLSFARNRGIAESKGDIIVFCDDDFLFDRGWLNAVAESFSDARVDCSEGRLLPQWETKKPKWLTSDLYGKLALYDLGNEQFRIYNDSFPLFGSNVAYRKNLFEKYGQYSTLLGRKGTRLFSGEDTALMMKMLRSGMYLLYQPRMIVHHRISKERMTKHYFRRWHYDSGISLAYSEDINNAEHTICSIPRYMVRSCFNDLVRYVILLFTDFNASFKVQCKLISYFSLFRKRICLHFGRN